MTEIPRDFADHTYRLLRGLHQQPKDAYPKRNAYVVPPARHYARIPWWTFRTPVYDDVYVFFGKRMEDKATGFSPDPIETEDTEICWSQDEEYDDPSNKRRNILDEDITLTFEVELDSDDDEDDFKAKVSNKDPTFKVDFRVIKKQNQPSGVALNKDRADYCYETQNKEEEKMSSGKGDHGVENDDNNQMSENKDDHRMIYIDENKMFEKKMVYADNDWLFWKNGDHDMVFKVSDEISEKNGVLEVVYRIEDNMSGNNDDHCVKHTGNEKMPEIHGDHNVVYTDKENMPEKNNEPDVGYTDKGKLSEKTGELNVVYNDDHSMSEENDAYGVVYTGKKYLTLDRQDHDTDLPTCNSNTQLIQNETNKDNIDHDDNDMEGLFGIYARGQCKFICLNEKVKINTKFEDDVHDMLGVLGVFSSE